MKITFDYQIFSHQIYGGISRYFYFLSKELLHLDQDVKIFAGFYQNNYIRDLPSNLVSGTKIKYPKYPWKLRNFLYFINNFICQTQIKLWKPDLIHETYFSSFSPRVRGPVRVTSVYDLAHKLYMNLFDKNDPTISRMKKTFNRVDHIFSISNNTKKDVIELLGVNESKISVVHLGVDLDVFKNQNNKKSNIEKPYILYVGTRKGAKNFNRFLEACSNSVIIKNKIKIVVFGGENFDFNELSKIKKFGFLDGIVEHMTGDDKKLAALYASALCFVYPSIYEGFGLPPLEAMASGCPVAASNTSSMPEIINNAGEYFNPYDTEDIQNTIERIILSNTRREELISLGYENIKLFSWSKCAKKSLDIYRNLVGKS